jgi:hypothetical protein
MGLLDKFKALQKLENSSFNNAIHAVESIHQIVMEVPVNMLEDIGYPTEKAELIKDGHKNIIGHLYGGVRSAHGHLDALIYKQVEQLDSFKSDISSDKPADTKPVAVEASKNISAAV